MNFFASFIVPVHNRQHTLNRCIGSIYDQGLVGQKGAYELVIVDDASTDLTPEIIKSWQNKMPKSLNLLRFNDHLERIYAFNAGILAAQGEWIIMLDSDDKLSPDFREKFEEAVDKYPNAKVLNWASRLHWKDGNATERPAYRPEIGEDGLYKPFRSGGIASGAYAFKKECLNKTGYMPLAKDCYEFGRKMKAMFPEVIPLYTLPDGRVHDDLGNPWGQDWALFYMLSRHFISQPIDHVMHEIYVR